MSSLWWSAFLTPFGLLGMYISGRKNKWGWLLGMCTQVLWVGYAIDTKGYFFILGSMGYFTIYLKNFVVWYKADKKKESRTDGRLPDQDSPDQAEEPPGAVKLTLAE